MMILADDVEAFQILLGSLMVASGFYLLMNTVPQGWKFKTETFLINCLLGIVIMILGSLFAANAFLG